MNQEQQHNQIDGNKIPYEISKTISDMPGLATRQKD